MLLPKASKIILSYWLILIGAISQDFVMVLAAAVGVEHIKSAAKASRGTSLSWPMAAITGQGKSTMALTSISLLNACSDSKEPPPRITTNTSISCFLNCVTAPSKSFIASWPSTRESIILILKPNLPRLLNKSLITAPFFEVITPMFWGNSGKGLFRSAAKSPSSSNLFFKSS